MKLTKKDNWTHLILIYPSRLCNRPLWTFTPGVCCQAGLKSMIKAKYSSDNKIMKLMNDENGLNSLAPDPFVRVQESIDGHGIYRSLRKYVTHLCCVLKIITKRLRLKLPLSRQLHQTSFSMSTAK